MDRPGRTSHAAILVASLLPIALLPFSVRYWPNEDNANHLAVAHIVTHYFDAGAPWRELFTLRLGPRPYVLHVWLLALLGRLTDLPTADKILISVASVAQPLSSLWLARRLAPARPANAYLLLPLTASSYLLNRGFTPFVLGLSLANLTVGYAVSAGPRQRRFWPLLSLGLFGTTLFHPYATALALGMMAAWFALGGERRLWGPLLLSALPSVALYAVNLIGTHGLALPQAPPICVAPLDCPRIWAAWSPLELLSTLVALSWEEGLIRGVALALIVAGLVIEFRKRTGDATLRRLFLVVGAAFLLMPWGIARRAFHLPERVLLMVYVVGAATAQLPRRLPARAPLWLALVSCLGLAAAQYAAARRENPELERIVRLGSELPRGAKLAYLNHHLHGRMALAQPEQFAWGYLVVDRDVVTPDLFADGVTSLWGGVGYRPLVYRHPEQLPWIDTAMPEPELLERLRAYDWVMVVGADEDRLAALSRALIAVRHEEDVWLFRAR